VVIEPELCEGDKRLGGAAYSQTRPRSEQREQVGWLRQHLVRACTHASHDFRFETVLLGLQWRLCRWARSPVSWLSSIFFRTNVQAYVACMSYGRGHIRVDRQERSVACRAMHGYKINFLYVATYTEYRRMMRINGSKQ
jgi:hypothetical protein